MPEIENDPITWKSFKSLPRLALMTWIIVFAVDAIFIAPNDYIEDFTKLIYIWSIGYSVAVVFEVLRIYKKRETIKEKGDRLFIPLNALLIFFYASAYNGFTKQVGSWSQASDILDEEEALKLKQDDASLFAAIEGWAVPVLAQQTSYWPDVKVIAEKHELIEENLTLKRSLGDTGASSDGAGGTSKEDLELKQKIAELRDSIETLSKEKPSSQVPPSYDDSALRKRIADLDQLLADCNNGISSLKPEVARLQNQKDELLRRINEHNQLQQRWVTTVPQRRPLQTCVNTFKEFFEPGYYDQLLGKPIDTNLP